MKILIYSDNHWSQYSSIVRQRGDKYSLRLENQIKSINWAESLAITQGCNVVVHLGDFFDSSSLNSEEITALKEVRWANEIPHYFLVGNHEIGTRNLEFNSVHVLTNNTPFNVIDTLTTININDFTELVFLPYTFESDRKSLTDTLSSKRYKRIIFSHNDIKGIQMGKFQSKEGYEISDIQANCDLFINGHLHNGEKVADKIINCGNLTGQNFGEDATKYDHVALVLDTDTLRVAVFENPYAFNFYKLDFYENDSIEYINATHLKHNAVCSIRCAESDLHYLKVRFGNEKDDLIPKNCNVVASRFIIVPEKSNENVSEEQLTEIDHLNVFKEYITQTLGTSEIITTELMEICK